MLGMVLNFKLKKIVYVFSDFADNIPGVENRASVANLATVAVLPASSDVPLTNFTLELQHALKAIGISCFILPVQLIYREHSLP